MAEPVTLADMIRRAVANGDTYTRIADALGVTTSAVQQWANGKTIPWPHQVDGLARELRRPVAEVARARLEARLDRELERHDRELAEIRRELEQLD